MVVRAGRRVHRHDRRRRARMGRARRGAGAAGARATGRAIARLDKALGPDLGQCCGGRVLLTIERFGAADREAIAPLAAAERARRADDDRDGRRRRPAGAPRRAGDEARSPRPAYDVQSDGRVYRALRRGADAVLSVRRRPCRARAGGRAGAAAVRRHLDRHAAGRDSRNSSRRTSPAITQGDPVALLARAPDGAFVAVMTHSHALDLDLVIAALQADRFAYVGLIGSATKRARFTSAMQQDGHGGGRDRQARLPDRPDRRSRDKAPAAIAASVAAQVLMAREAVAVASTAR